jgi:hypothetical protein
LDPIRKELTPACSKSCCYYGSEANTLIDLPMLVNETVPFVRRLFAKGVPGAGVNTYVHEHVRLRPGANISSRYRPMFSARNSTDVVAGIGDTRALLRAGKARETGLAGYGLVGERVGRPAWAA